MEDLNAVARFLLPWEFYPAVFILCVGTLALYWRGLRHRGTMPRPHGARRLSLYTGIGLVYFVMQTRFDFLSQHMFFIHRLQHLVLHHLGPFLIAMAQPVPVLTQGLPPAFLRAAARMPGRRAVRFVYRLLQNAVIAPALFVGLIAFWLTPSIHFKAMLSAPLYGVMNWSMLIDGLLFWMLMLDPRTLAEGALIGIGTRVIIVFAAMVPQLLIGARIVLARPDLYNVYDVCGRAWNFSAATDQRLGGLIIWIPAAMMHVVAALVLIGRWMRADHNAMQNGKRSAPLTLPGA